jgi:hypothetical protein
MDAGRFDRLTRHLSRRGLAAMVGGGILSGQVNEIQASEPDFTACGGVTDERTKFCPWIRKCATDDDCTAPCTCVERKTGCCWKERRRKKNGGKRVRRKCAKLFGSFCTPPAWIGSQPTADSR